MTIFPSTPPGSGRAVCGPLREDTAVALLCGEPLPQAARDHQTRCRPCRDEFARLAVLPGLLDASRDERVPRAEVPDEALLLRTLAEMRHRRRRQRRRFVLLAAAAAVVLAVPAGTLVARQANAPSPGQSGTIAEPQDMLVATGTAQDPASPVGADVQVLARGEGLGSMLVVAPWGLASGTTCRIELVDTGGWTHPVRTWVVPEGYERGWRAQVPVSVAPKEVADVRLVDDATGTVLLTVPVRSA